MKFTFEVPDDLKMDPRKVRAMLMRGFLAFQKERLNTLAFNDLRALGAESTESTEATVTQVLIEASARHEREEKAWRSILTTFEGVP